MFLLRFGRRIAATETSGCGSRHSPISVFAQELMPHRFGMISGVFSGIGGLGATVLGKFADHTSIAFVDQLCALLPTIGLLAVVLPKTKSTH